jgi:hypothetical protein
LAKNWLFVSSNYCLGYFILRNLIDLYLANFHSGF